jgi:hypothetical protein
MTSFLHEVFMKQWMGCRPLTQHAACGTRDPTQPHLVVFSHAWLGRRRRFAVRCVCAFDLTLTLVHCMHAHTPMRIQHCCSS